MVPWVADDIRRRKALMSLSKSGRVSIEYGKHAEREQTYSYIQSLFSFEVHDSSLSSSMQSWTIQLVDLLTHGRPWILPA
jgi:hypothetical protein